jgi:hypothetical protein
MGQTQLPSRLIICATRPLVASDKPAANHPGKSEMTNKKRQRIAELVDRMPRSC